MRATPGTSARPPLYRRLDRIARRRRLRLLVEATVAAIALALGVVGLAVAWMMHALFDPSAVATARVAVWTILPLLAVVPLVFGWRRMTRLQAARYAEAIDPRFDAVVISAADVGAGSAPGSLQSVLAGQAAAALSGSQTLRRREVPRLRRAGAALGLVLLAAALVAWLAPQSARYGVGLLLHGDRDPLAASPFTLTVSPGSLRVAEGSNLPIEAVSSGFRPGGVELLLRPEGEPNWRVEPLIEGAGAGVFVTLLPDLERTFDYYVRSGPVTSGRHRVEVEPRPVVERIDALYTYPAYTGRSPELRRDIGAVRAVRGSRVELRVNPSRPVAGAELVLGGSRRIALEPWAEDLRHAFVIEADGSYRIELPSGLDDQVSVTPEYPIEAFVDDRAQVVLESPGRDARVTPIEELEILLQATDDVAVAAAELVYSVNGGKERVISFAADASDPLRVSARHVLALEDMGLEPGDMISYYARATDAPQDVARRVATDLYFFDVRPFEKSFREAGGRAGGGGGGGGEAELTAQQRSLVVALFKLQRDRDSLEQSSYGERMETLKTAQGRIRDRVDAIVRRLAARDFMSEHQGYRRMAEEMPRAARAMVDAEGSLALRELDPAVSDARRALLHLQRADAAFREVRVGMQRGQGSGEASQTELANLFQLEMDRFRNPYQDLQRGDREGRQRSLDEALEKLRELSRRQQREVERAQMRAMSGASGDTRNSQQLLMEQVEELMRRLERLTRERESPAPRQEQEVVEGLAEAREAMRRAARDNDPGAAAEALERLRALRRELERRGEGTIAGGVGDAERRAAEAVAEQRDIDRVAGEAAEQRGEADGALAERRRRLADRVEELGDRVQRLQQRALQLDDDSAGDLDAAARALRQRRIAERIRQSAGAVSGSADGGEESEGLVRDLQSVRESLAEASRRAGAAPGADDDDGEALRQMVRQLKRDQQRLTEAAAGSGSGERTSGSTGAPGGETTAGPAAPGAGAWGGWNGTVDIPGMRAGMIERLRRLGPLVERFDGNGSMAEDISALVAALEAVSTAPSMREFGELRARQAALLRAAQELELAARESTPIEDAPPTRGEAPVPPPWQPLVEEYFRELGGSSPVNGDR